MTSLIYLTNDFQKAILNHGHSDSLMELKQKTLVIFSCHVSFPRKLYNVLTHIFVLIDVKWKTSYWKWIEF